MNLENLEKSLLMPETNIKRNMMLNGELIIKLKTTK